MSDSARGGATPRVRTLSVIVFALLVVFAAYACDDTVPEMNQAVSSTASSVTGAGGGSSCNEGKPDGYCVADGAAAEDCSCSDCAGAAKCRDACTDDDKCDLEGDEDCSCVDCFNKVPQCSPGGGNCSNPDPESNQYDPMCAFGERCTCSDCTDTAYCKDNCVDNGECVPLFEGCSCADCVDHADCQGSSTMASSSAATAGAGGSGGQGGSGGKGGAGGAGGAGGKGGAGGS